MPADLDAIKKEWLNPCGACDAGLPMACTHPSGDYRPVMLSLVDEIGRLRVLTRNVDLFGTGYLWRRPDGVEVVLDPAEVLVVIDAGEVAHTKEVIAAARVVRALRRGAAGINPDEAYRGLDVAVDLLDGVRDASAH
jgi:hypothetical protein